MKLEGLCPLTTAEALRRAVTIAPDIDAVVTKRERMTYAELDETVRRLRSALAAHDVRRGTRVGICLGNEPTWVALFLAISSLGAVTVPVNTRFRTDEFAQVLRQTRVELLFLTEKVLTNDMLGMLRQACPEVDTALPSSTLPDLTAVVVVDGPVPAAATSWNEFLAGAGAEVAPTCTPDDIALIQSTSGTTSYPKGVLLTHRSMCANAFFSGGRMGFRIGDRFHSARPFFHVAGSTLSVLSALQHSVTLVTMPKFDAGDALELMERERCTHFSGNDTIALLLLNHPDRPHRNLTLRGAWVAASPAVIERVIGELGATECVAGYGLSESSPNVAQSAWWEDEATRVAAKMRVEPGLEVRIRSLDTDADCPPGINGEILVRGWSLMQGYDNMPQETAHAIDPDGWLHTGDLGNLDEDGRLSFVGRTKEIIRVGGENVSPAEVEDALHRHPAIKQAVVVGVPDPRLIEVPFAFVVLNNGHALETEDILAWLRPRIAGFKVPKYAQVVGGFEGIGMTASSKVQKRHLATHAETLLSERISG